MIIIESGGISIGPGITVGDIPALVDNFFISENDLNLITETDDLFIEEFP
jgi:hypothetical protein|tara:strand:- start:190 stop:339 length:150 start_codon:yes stop_codon:yes gene_type:complete